jgi:CelD/BcsL family acetyltransferase involved in cellulose biosynthesis
MIWIRPQTAASPTTRPPMRESARASPGISPVSPATPDDSLRFQGAMRAPPAEAIGRSRNSVEQLTTRAEFLALAEQWDALAERCDDQVFYRHDFFRVWLAHFAAGDELRILALRDATGRLTAVLPLRALRSRMFGIAVRELCAVGNLHSCRFDLLADDPAVAADAFITHLRSRRDWDLLRITDAPVYGRAPKLLAAAERAGLPGGLWISQLSPYLRLEAGWDVLERSLDKRFRSSLRRRRRRLQQHGVVTVERYGSGDRLDEKLQEGLALEAGGWKGRAGTAVVQDPETHAFYRALAAHAADRGELALWFLRVDGRAVAFDFALERGDRLLLLKTAYDERFADCSPGQLLLEDELRDACARGLRECDFLGPQTQAKRDWTRTLRAHCWVFVFRGVRGRLLSALKFRLVPAFKRLRAA